MSSVIHLVIPQISAKKRKRGTSTQEALRACWRPFTRLFSDRRRQRSEGYKRTPPDLERHACLTLLRGATHLAEAAFSSGEHACQGNWLEAVMAPPGVKSPFSPYQMQNTLS